MKKELFNEVTSIEEETFELGKRIIRSLPKEVNIINLRGNVGVGKTVLVRGMANELGIKENITSPTFGYKIEYKGLIHYDLFLVKKMRTKEFLSFITEDLENNLVVIEWGEKIPTIKNTLIINIKNNKEDKREIKVILK